MGKNEVANRLRFAPNNFPKGLVEQLVAEFTGKIINPLLVALCVETHRHNLFAAMLKMNVATISKPVSNLHQSRLVIDSKIDLREQPLTFRF
jgi:hypothetical protein